MSTTQRRERPMRRWISWVRPPILPRSALAGGAGEGGAGQHAVLGGDPAAAGVAQPAGDALLDGGVAEDAGVAGFDEDGAFGHDDVAGGDADGAEGVGGAVVGPEELRWGLGHEEIIVARIF